MNECRKVRRLPKGTGSIFEINFAESEYLGEVDFEGLLCVKVKVLMRRREKDRPVLHVLWLAKEYNYLCVKSQALATFKGVDHVLAESKIDALRELEEGLFISQKVSVNRYDYLVLIEGKKIVDSKLSLLVKSANFSPGYSVKELALDVPEDLPKYGISADHRLINSPNHPTPTGEPPSTNLEEIVTAIRKAEKKYQNIDISLFEHYRHLNRKNEGIERWFRSTRRTKTKSRTIGSQGRFFHVEDKINLRKDGTKHRTQKTVMSNGKVAQSASASNRRNPNSLNITSVVVSFEEDPILDIVRPHMLLFRSLSDHRPLSKVLDSNWYNHNNDYPVNIVYEGDDFIDGELCHKLRRDLVTSKGEVMKQHFIWIAPEKSFLPIRTEWKERRKSLNLPYSVHAVTSLKVLSPGVWMPMEIRSATFQWLAASGMSEGRLIHQWQRDITVKNVSLAPKVDDKLFSELTVPAGTYIYLRNAEGKLQGPVRQPKEGPPDVSDEQLH